MMNLSKHNILALVGKANKNPKWFIKGQMNRLCSKTLTSVKKHIGRGKKLKIKNLKEQ